MKNRTMKAMVAAVSTVLLVGCTEATGHTMTTADSYIDLNTVIGYSGTNDGLQLYTNDGNGYYLETELIQPDTATQVFYIATSDNYDRLIDALECRNGKIIIEVSNGTVTNDNGDGVDVCGYYRHYDMDRFSESDTVQSVFVYNPDSNYTDDILYRIDIPINQIGFMPLL